MEVNAVMSNQTNENAARVGSRTSIHDQRVAFRDYSEGCVVANSTNPGVRGTRACSLHTDGVLDVDDNMARWRISRRGDIPHFKFSIGVDANGFHSILPTSGNLSR